MEAASSVASTRGASMPVPSSSRKEWRAVSDNQPIRNAGDEEVERSKLGQSDERTIYEHGRDPVDVDFCSITIDGSLDGDILQQQLHDVSRQREDLQRMEIDLRAQVIARTEIMEIRSSFDSQIKEHANTVIRLQDQLQDREHAIHELERKVEDKDRELQAIKLEKEAAWAKEDLLREQNKELATFRLERDHSEAERAKHIKQIHDLQEHIQEKERQLIELQEQYRATQETILYKDEQMREAQAWIARVQEMDVLQSSTNHSLQAELRERTEQYNQLWLGCQRQFAEIERVHLHTIQQLQLELADARERNGGYNDDSRISQTNLKESSQFPQKSTNQADANGNGAANAITGVLPNGTSENVPSFASAANSSTQNDHAPSVPLAPSSLFGMPTYLPPGQVNALHSFVMHQQGVPHSVPSQVPQNHAGPFHSAPAISSIQQWQDHQTATEGLQVSAQNLSPSQTDQTHVRAEEKYQYNISVNGQHIHPEYLDHISQGTGPDSVMTSSTGKGQVLDTIGGSYLVAQPDQSLEQVSSQFHDALRLSSLEKDIESKEQNLLNLSNIGSESQVLSGEQASPATASPSERSLDSVSIGGSAINNGTGAVLPETLLTTGQLNMIGKTPEVVLLDERSLLACIVRTIPAGGRIRISSTLPNRLGKMLSPLHWHDYKKKYGKLDDFVASHPELFLIEGDSIQLREGAQEMIAATAAVAKVAAAAAVSTYSSYLPSVAVTPMARAHRSKKFSSIDSNHSKNDDAAYKEYAAMTANVAGDSPQLSSMQNQHPNGVCFSVPGGVSNIKLLSKSKEHSELNGANFDRASVTSTESRGSTHGRSNSTFVGKQSSRTMGVALSSRR